MILDQHRHKLYHPQKQKSENKPKLPKNDQRCMYRQTYTFSLLKEHSGIPECCAYSQPKESTHELTQAELDSVQGFLKPLDSYGYKKIQCEEMMAQYAKANDDILFVALRFADVIGPFDDSHRLWKYTTWMQALHGAEFRYFTNSKQPASQSHKKLFKIDPTKFPSTIGFEQKDCDQLLSFTFSCDVVSVINALLGRKVTLQQRFQAFNIACKEQLTLQQFLELTLTLVQEISPVKQPKKKIIRQIKMDESGSSSGSFRACEKFYPSVECGPISINSANQLLGFEPTSLADALRRSIEFLLSIDQVYTAQSISQPIYLKEINEMVQELKEAFGDGNQNSSSSSSDSEK